MNGYEQLHAAITAPDTPQAIADSLRAGIASEVINAVTSDNFDWSDRRVICAL